MQTTTPTLRALTPPNLQETPIDTAITTQSPTSTHLPVQLDVRTALAKTMQRVLAATLDLYMRTKQAHWNVRGPFFFARHELFDKIADTRLTHADLIAERIGTVGAAAAGSVESVHEASPLPTNRHEHLDGSRHLQDLIACYGAYVADVRKALAHAADLDPITEDLLIEVSRKTELDLWFLESHMSS